MSFLLRFSASVLLACTASAAVVDPGTLAPALFLAASVPAFRASVVSQIQLIGSLSAQAAPSLTPLLSAAPTAADPFRAESARLVGALAAQPEAAAASAAPLRAAFGDQPVDQLLKAAARIQTGAAAHPELAAQLAGLKQGLDISNPSSVQDYTSRLNALFDNSRAASAAEAAAAVSVDGPSTRRPLVSLVKHGETPVMTERELEDYVAARSVTSPRGLTRVNFASGDYKQHYDAALRRLGVDMVVVKAPSRAELAAFSEDDGYHLKSEYVRWVTPSVPLDQFEASFPNGRWRSNFKSQLQKSADLPFELKPLTQERFAQWYPIYEDEVVGKPGGKRNVFPNFVDQQREQGKLGELYGLFYFDPQDRSRMVGGVIMRASTERHMLIGHFAAYRPEIKELAPSFRTFAEAMQLALRLGLPVFSLGEDTNFYGYDYNIGLMANKAGLQMSPYPSDEIVLMKVLDTGKIASVKNKQGQSAGYFFFGIPRTSPVVGRYLASKEAGAPKESQELLGSPYFFTPETDPASRTTVGRLFKGDDPNAVRMPTGIPIIEQPMAPARAPKS